MASYKNYEKIYLGGSDMASLIVRDASGVYELHFGEDGSYSAYLVDEHAEIGAHYKKAHTSSGWAWVYDDMGRVAELNAKTIVFYRAGDFGLIIQKISD